VVGQSSDRAERNTHDSKHIHWKRRKSEIKSNPKMARRKKILKIQAEITEIMNKEIIEKINEKRAGSRR